MAKARTIDYKTIVAHGPCREQRLLFLRTFGRQPVPVTVPTCRKMAQDFDWWWANAKFCTPQQYPVYRKLERIAERAYAATEKRIRRELKYAKIYRAYMHAGGYYLDENDPKRVAFQAVDDKFDKRMLPVNEKLNIARAVAFAKAYNL